MPDSPKWGEGYVRWKEFVSIVLTMIVAGACSFGYVINIHANASQSNVKSVKERVDRIEKRTVDSLRRIEDKLDDALKP
jgi:hypothetical protein